MPDGKAWPEPATLKIRTDLPERLHVALWGDEATRAEMAYYTDWMDHRSDDTLEGEPPSGKVYVVTNLLAEILGNSINRNWMEPDDTIPSWVQRRRGDNGATKPPRAGKVIPIHWDDPSHENS